MGACSKCGVMLQPGDRFCNGCGTAVAAGATPGAAPRYAPAPAPQGYPPQPPQAYPPQPSYAPHHAHPEAPYVPSAYAPPASPAYAAPAPAPQTTARCQLGHEVVRGTSYCALGHPIALDQMQFANDGYAAALSPTYAAPIPAPQHAPRPEQPQQRVSGPAPAPQAHASAPQPQAYAPQPPAAHAAYSPAGAKPLPAPAYERPPLPAGSRGEAVREPPPKVLRGFVVAYGRNPNGDFWPLTGGRHTIGRFGSSDGIEIPIQDPTVSSRHATLIVDAATGSIVVEDAGSTNGTFVNDEPIGRSGWRELRDGDRLRVGGFTTVVKVIGPI
jgi:hypothetical protein